MACAPGRVCSAGTCQCPFGLTSCGNQCVSTSNDPRNCGACGNSCGTGPTNGCVNGMCVCSAGLTRCNNTCIDTRFDENNCGGCGTVCPGNQQCSNGMCVPL